MKILNLYILKAYISRLISVFVVLMLIFIIQTFWLFIDEFAGKGLDSETIFKFLIYYTPKLFPLVFPLSVLLSSIMTYGTLAENNEFTAMKSSGISLQNSMKFLIIFHLFLGFGSYYFSNYIIPLGEFKYYNLRRNLAKLKPALAISEGVFNEIGEINIKVSKKFGEDNRFLEDVIIHEKSPDNKNRVVIKAKSGELVSASIDQELKLILFNGNRYEEIYTKKPDEKLRYQHAKVSFEKYVMNIDLSNFNNVDLAEEKYTSTYKMQKVNDLYVSIDSLQKKFSDSKNTYAENLIKTRININPKLVDLNQKKSARISSIYCENPNPLTLIIDPNYNQHVLTLNRASNNVKTIIRNLESKKRVFFSNQKVINLHKTTLNGRYTLGFSVFFLFIIGASLGAIIRKGGLGLPIVLAILIFLTYHYIGLFGKNAAEDNTVSPLLGSWIDVIIIIPFAIYLVNRATNDRGLVNYNFIFNPLSDVFEKIKKKVR